MTNKQSCLLTLILLASCSFAVQGALPDLSKNNLSCKFQGNINKAHLSEPSGIVFHSERGTLFSIGDEGDICELRTDGSTVQQKRIMSADFEGITYVPSSGFLYIVIEGAEKIIEVDPASLITLRTFTINRTFDSKTVLAAGGEGIEAITFAPDAKHSEGGTFFAANQCFTTDNKDDGSAVVEIQLPLKSSQKPTDVGIIINHMPFDTIDLSGIQHRSDMNHLYLISDSKNSLFVVSLDGKIIKTHRLPGKKQEGITFDNENNMYIAQDSGEIIKYAITKSTNKTPPTTSRIKPASKARVSENALTIKEVTMLAIASSDTTAELRAAVKVALQEKSATTDIVDPELRVSYSSGSSESINESEGIKSVKSEDDSGYRMGLRLFPPNPWIRAEKTTIGKANHYAAIADLRHAHWTTSIQVRELFAQIDYLKRDVKKLDVLVSIFKDIKDNVKQGANEGTATLQDVVKASQAHLASLSERNAARRELNEAMQNLAGLIDLPASRIELIHPESLIPDLSKLDIDALMNDVVQNRADISALSWRAIAAKAAYDEIKADNLPWLQHIQLSYSENEDDDRLSSGDEWRVDAAINIPIFARLNNAPNVIMAQYEEAKVRETKAIEKASLQTKDAVATLQIIEQNQTQYQKETAPVIKEMQELLTNIESTEGLPPIQTAIIHKEILETERLSLKVDYEYQMAIIRLETILGIRFVKKM